MTSGAQIAPPPPLARVLREVRELSNLTQAEMATEIGTFAKLVSNYETGRHEPQLRVLRRYAEFAGLTVAQLLDGVL